MKITTLNLRHGGSSRVGGIIDYLASTESDVLVLSEFRHNEAGAKFTKDLAKYGYVPFASSTKIPRENGAAIFASKGAKPVTLSPEPDDLPRIVACCVADVVIAGVYFAQNKAKKSLFDYLCSRPKAFGNDFLVIGDFNTGSHFKDEVGATFHCSQEFERLADQGYIDLWRKVHGNDACEYSWFSNRGNGFRIDHAFGSKTVSEQLVACSYDHTTRQGLSDHSSMTVLIDR